MKRLLIDLGVVLSAAASRKSAMENHICVFCHGDMAVGRSIS